MFCWLFLIDYLNIKAEQYLFCTGYSQIIIRKAQYSNSPLKAFKVLRRMFYHKCDRFPNYIYRLILILYGLRSLNLPQLENKIQVGGILDNLYLNFLPKVRASLSIVCWFKTFYKIIVKMSLD